MRREIAAIKLHTFDHLTGSLQTLALFYGYDAIPANLVHSLGQNLANGRIVIGSDGGNLTDLFGSLNRAGHFAQLGHNGFNSLLDAA